MSVGRVGDTRVDPYRKVQYSICVSACIYTSNLDWNYDVVSHNKKFTFLTNGKYHIFNGSGKQQVNKNDRQRAVLPYFSVFIVSFRKHLWNIYVNIFFFNLYKFCILFRQRRVCACLLFLLNILIVLKKLTNVLTSGS